MCFNNPENLLHFSLKPHPVYPTMAIQTKSPYIITHIYYNSLYRTWHLLGL